MIIDCKYILSEGDIPKLEGCATSAIIDEHIESISSGLRTVSITIEVDDDWGFCNIIAVNGMEVGNNK